MTVDQSGENVLFVADGEYMEAHVQIRYQGDPERLAWLIPLPAEPEITVGSEPLFRALLEASRPIFGLRTTVMHCDGSEDTREDQGCGGSFDDLDTAGGAGQASAESEGMDDAIGRTVGSFEVTLLEPTGVDELVGWLDENAFDLPERSAELLEPYVRQGAVFAALRLRPGAGVQEIHPVVFRYRGTRPAIPLQLTAVAATTDMRVRVLILGEGRAVPSNFRHVELNQLRLHWPSLVTNYESVVSRAVDETGDGLGFVTEYAGNSAVVDRGRVFDDAWNAEAFAGLGAAGVLAELQAQGLADCSSGACSFSHPLLLPLLQRHLPAPQAQDERRFYACAECIEDSSPATDFDTEAFAEDYQARIVTPGAQARALLERHPYLTRMMTLISPEEMTVDPVFHLQSELPDVDRERWAERVVPCMGKATFHLPDGRQLLEPGPFEPWPGTDRPLPYAERIEMLPERGQPHLVSSASARIDAAVAELNAERSQAAAPTNDGSAGGSIADDGGLDCAVGRRLGGQNFWLALSCLWLFYRRGALRRLG
ncbi:MAG: DUF2330 domain-containing protein [Myxococcales bacterium]|nr:DUF2330 domain-containing protein [Myxococcales bacterium]